MPIANASVVVNRRPEEVFAYLADVSRHGEWSPKPYRVEALTEGRQAIHSAKPEGFEWATPVLFLRMPDGNVFVAKPAEPQEASHASTSWRGSVRDACFLQTCRPAFRWSRRSQSSDRQKYAVPSGSR